jgi:hypothetical protein
VPSSGVGVTQAVVIATNGSDDDVTAVHGGEGVLGLTEQL